MTRIHHVRSGARRQTGIGMIEILIAVLVVSIGFLGMAALQARALSTNNSAMARTMATIATYSILDAMRADLTGAGTGAYNTTVTGSSCPNGTGGLAASQLNSWCNQLAARLGAVASTTGNIACTTVSNTQISCTITVQFDDSRAGAGGSTTQKVVTSAML